jgi:pimeloyl-ACP methyl ester carboxylesterase
MKTLDVTINGVRSPVCDSGPETNDEAVVFVHGNPGSMLDWADLMGRVSPFCRAIAMDMPGFGRADKPIDFPYNVDGYADHLQGLLDALGVRRVHLVLHDFGGPWGMQWAAAHPEALASATLLNTGAFLDYRWHFLARIWRTPKLGELFMAITTRPAWNLLLKIGNPRGLPKEAAARMFDDFDPGTRQAVLKLYRATSDPSGTGYAQCRALRPYNRPALVVWGTSDVYLPYKQLAERQREAFPAAEIVALENSGHFPFLDNPEGTAAAVVPFLKKQIRVQ